MQLKKQFLSNHILAISVGLVYLWFGGLKFFSALSPAEDLAINTINLLTFGLIPSHISLISLAIWESVIGILLLINIFRKPVIIFSIIHMVFTFTPLLLFVDQSFNEAPFALTLIGQYIVKNLIIIAALITLYRLPSFTVKNELII